MIAIIVVALVASSGWFEPLLPAGPPVLLGITGVVLTTFGLAAAGYLAWRLLGKNYRISGLMAGGASISLSEGSVSYFDKYLDEIVYLFQVSRMKVVVFEDIDRFEDVEIFDTLRSLNTLLNNSEQLGEETITFIFAVRDSVFERIGASNVGQKSEQNQNGDGGVVWNTTFVGSVRPRSIRSAISFQKIPADNQGSWSARIGGCVGAAGDNAAMERFFSTLQKNVFSKRRWSSRDELRTKIVYQTTVALAA